MYILSRPYRTSQVTISNTDQTFFPNSNAQQTESGPLQIVQRQLVRKKSCVI